LKAFLFVSLSWQVTVMIMSLKAASLGLNMVSACHVLLLDVWWNPTTEDQAIDRAHRIGQTRAVNVSRFTVKNTIEDRILALQACTLSPSSHQATTDISNSVKNLVLKNSSRLAWFLSFIWDGGGLMHSRNGNAKLCPQLLGKMM
jgi:hypothetical protein